MSMKGRILYAAFDVVPSPKGASTHILHFLRGLVNGKYPVHLITPGDGVLPEHDTLEGACVTRVPPAVGQSFLARASAFGSAVMGHIAQNPAYEFVHYRSIWSGLPLTQAKHRYAYKTIYEVNGLPSIEIKYHYPGLKESNLIGKIREQELATLALSDAIICVSQVTRSFLISLGVSPERIHVVPNGVSSKDFQATPLNSLNGRIPEILYVGTLADWQGLSVLISAMPLIVAERPVRLRILGRGRSRQRKELNKRIRKMGLAEFVHLEPPLPHHQIPAAIAGADLCVAPLGLNDRNVVQGCCPIKILEYMASGRPLIASNLPVVRELVREEIDGLLFWPEDPQELACQSLRLLADRDLAERLAASASRRVHRSFTWQRARKKLLDIYSGLE